MYKKKIREKIVITGASGYIGSILLKNLTKNNQIFLIDKENFKFRLKHKFIKCDLSNKKKTSKILKKINPDTIVHLAAQSTIDMVKLKKNSYKKNNLTVTKNLIDIIQKLNVKKFIFSSTAAVYKGSNSPLKETSKLKPSNLYGKTKLLNEKYIIKNLKNTNTKYCIIRFFNVCSSDRKNNIGELHDPETHLLPIIIDKITKNKTFKIYGNNYKTEDGTCVRDYIHILDIVSGIKKSINYLENGKSLIINLGGSKGFSVKQIIKSCEKVIKKKLKLSFENKRFGDIDNLVCDVRKAKKILKWKPTNSKLNKIILDELNWNKYLKQKKIIRKFIY